MDIHKPKLWQGRRGLVLGLVSLGILLNYADRQIIAVLKPMLQHDLGWTDGDYGRMTSAFRSPPPSPSLARGLARRPHWMAASANCLGVALWSLAAIGHAFARTVGQFTVAQKPCLGVTEALNSPTAIKTAAALYPNELRAMAYGIISAASTLGFVVTPLVIPLARLENRLGQPCVPGHWRSRAHSGSWRGWGSRAGQVKSRLRRTCRRRLLRGDIPPAWTFRPTGATWAVAEKSPPRVRTGVWCWLLLLRMP